MQETIRKSIVITILPKIKQILKHLVEKPLPHSELKRRCTNVRGGTFSAGIADAQNMGLITKNGSVTITHEGRKLLNDDTPEFRIQLGRRLSVFEQMYKQGIRTREQAERALKPILAETYNDKVLANRVASVSLRYLELFFYSEKPHHKLGVQKLTPQQLEMRGFNKAMNLITLFKNLEKEYPLEQIKKVFQYTNGGKSQSQADEADKSRGV